MENEASKTRASNIAFLVDANALTNLENNILSEIKGTLEYKVKFSDGSTIKYPDADSIVGQPNSENRFIISILASVAGQPKCSAYVNLRSNPEPPVEYTVNGPQRDVIYLSAKLDDWIASCRQWYSAAFSSSIGTGIAVAAFFIPFYLMTRVSEVFPAKKPGLAGLIPLATLLIVGLIEYWIYKMLPRGTFAIGYGIKRKEKYNYILSALIAAFVISILAGLFTAWIAHHFLGF
jgi:hypothetical protein